MKNGVLLYQKDTQDADADVTWTTKRAGLLSIIQKNAENVAAGVSVSYMFREYLTESSKSPGAIAKSTFIK